MNIVKKIIRKLKAGAWYPFYNSFYEHLKLDRRLILLESRGGNALEGNIFYLIKNLQKEDYRNYRLVLSVRKEQREAVRKKLRFYHIDGINFVTTGSIRYYYVLATAGYLVNDTSFPGRFIKKEGQIYFNTWHGTPLKKMGKDNRDEVYSMGNVMRNLLQSDYLLFPNEYMQQKMSAAYSLDQLYTGTVLHEGYPRNGIFFDKKRAGDVKRELGCEGMQLIFYMPTYRGKTDHITVEEQLVFFGQMLRKMDEMLTSGQKLLVKLHPLLGKQLDLSGYKHIENAPVNYETYDVLNACDVLLTDYSSVMYDYICSGKKIILYAYDRAEYDKERGLYEDTAEYPFFHARTEEEIISALSKEQQPYKAEFLRRYATYEGEGAAERLCRRVFLRENCCREYRYPKTEKKNILIYAGDLKKNGVTTALLGMLRGLDLTKNNYFISFRKTVLEEEPERLSDIPSECSFLPIASEMNMDILTMAAYALYLKFGWNGRWIRQRLDLAYRREWKKHFGGTKLHHVVHYNGYERYMIQLFLQFSGLKSIWEHSDMLSEIRERGNQNYYQLREAYQSYDHVIVVSEDVVPSTREIGGEQANISVIENYHDYHRVLENAKRPFIFEEDTQSNRSREEIERILESKAERFINIGRFSVEKGHARLIEAFTEYWKEQPDSYLIIIGGTGELYQKTLELARQSEAYQHIILILSMRNPMPVLKRCQLFVMSSFYEGLGLVVLEADTLGIPVISCDIKGPGGFMRAYGGTIVPNDTAGLLHGMKLYHNGGVHSMNIDFEEWNRICIQKCEELFAE